MELIERYIYAVTRRLPQSQREEVVKELRGLIADMLDDQIGEGKVSDSHIEEVLMELGDPRELARQYGGKNKFVIGPVLFDPYMTVLKISLISIVLAMGMVFVIKVYMDPVQVIDHFVSFIVSTVITIPQGVGWVTLVFGLLEYFGGINEQKHSVQNTWKLADLPPLPDTKRQIKRCEPIAGIVFLVLLFMMFTSQYFGIFIFKNGELNTVIPFLNKEAILTTMPAIILLLGLGILKEALKLVYERWTKKLFLYTILINAISLAVVILMVYTSSFWNPNFMLELSQVHNIAVGSEAYDTTQTIWNTSTGLFVIFLIIGLIWEIVKGIFKMRKMS
ncbi:HAAS signaling domain-containing protein [Lederbergia panacisoli]|uniref:HAAS signaling domain-containing protein n=1 Tax=Lederbergia panacisoli TaxID=1255251 RepID=UPI00214C1E0A|nr:permease prefix domain 1-containing protein [Lederbergia panacisoli]MCR2822695.1 permease prefix domain 1-containing protein [Lederbergia panacisoli]